jgi:hypothetical protein
MTHEQWLKFVEEHQDWAVLPSPPDERDFIIRADPSVVIPPITNLPDPPFILDQLDSDQCVGATMAGIYNAYYNVIGQLPPGGFSMSALYFRCKELDGIPNTPGTFPRIALSIAQKEGLIPTSMFPFRKEKPIGDWRTEEMKREALKYRIKSYERLYTLDQIKQALAQGKYIFTASLVTKTNWEGTNGGYIGIPEGTWIGGHATLLKGHNDSLKHLNYTGHARGVNSWGEKWGDKGKFWMSYDFMRWQSPNFAGMAALQEMWAVEFDAPLPQQQETVMNVGSKIALVNGQEIELDVAPIIQNKRALVPLRFVAENVGYEAIWDNGKIILRK